MNIKNLSLVVWAVTLSASATFAVSIDTVTVRNVGNPPDRDHGSGQFGSVSYPFHIGATEVTNEQYAEFLNAVAASDPHELYNVEMGRKIRGGIARSGTNGNFSYSIRLNMGNKPVNYVSFWDAARFANWLNNGQPTGLQDATTTEDGAYTLGGVTFPPNDSVSRNAGATWFLPSEDEWYKAAYYDPRDEAQGGPPGDDHYWLYATQSDQDPTIARANAVGDISNAGDNVANYALGARWNGVSGNVTTVASAGPGSASYYGTYDMAGSVWEWNEAIVVEPRRSTESTFRGERGASWDDPAKLMRASLRGFGGIELCGIEFQCFNRAVGFRVASVANSSHPPGLGDFNKNGLLDAEDIDLLSAQIVVGISNPALDLNGDQKLNQQDRTIWVKELKRTWFGDANLDGRFNSSDIVNVFQKAEYEDSITGNSTWRDGDWNGDRDFTTSDIVLALQDGGFESGIRATARAVPEPAGAILLVLGLMSFATRRRAGRQRR